MKQAIHKIPTPERPDLNPAMPEAHGDGRISDEQSGNIGMQDVIGRGATEADRTHPTDIDQREPHHPAGYADMDETRRNTRKG